ncbi:peptide ABC transporter permease [Micromonospora tulbaghiae]|uniref:Peptide ABC transporter permease n=1 Tax=Micromonospora tulbaghiae TaxID=479978 RepID=A0A386WF19_9ACTN|nr:peptide ABC transporter permease [Micromonospora tulbaghiae]NED56472.1 ABC transporter permease [Micromonospora aurantiaca]
MTDPLPGRTEAGSPVGPWRRLVVRVWAQSAARVGIVIIALFIALAVFAPLIAAVIGSGPNDFHEGQIDKTLGGLPKGRLGGVSEDHWLGVEPVNGRDVLARIVYGARISLLIAVLATAVSVIVGTVLGMVAGFFGGWIDTAISRLMDLVLSFPQLIFMIALVAVLPDQGRTMSLILVIGFFGWPYIGRIVRGQTLSLRHREFVEAAWAGGQLRGTILLREILPNLTSPILVYATLSIPANIGTEAALSFLGIGVQPPTPSWGQMMQKAMSWYQVDPMFFLVPGICLFLTVLGFTLFGDALRDATDPKSGV